SLYGGYNQCLRVFYFGYISLKLTSIMLFWQFCSYNGQHGSLLLYVRMKRFYTGFVIRLQIAERIDFAKFFNCFSESFTCIFRSQVSMENKSTSKTFCIVFSYADITKSAIKLREKE